MYTIFYVHYNHYRLNVMSFIAIIQSVTQNYITLN